MIHHQITKISFDYIILEGFEWCWTEELVILE